MIFMTSLCSDKLSVQLMEFTVDTVKGQGNNLQEGNTNMQCSANLGLAPKCRFGVTRRTKSKCLSGRHSGRPCQQDD